MRCAGLRLICGKKGGGRVATRAARWFAATALALLLTLVCPHGASAAPPVPGRTVKLGANKHLPPYEFLNEYDMFKGFNVDLINALAIETNQDIEVYPMSWALARISLNRGYVDGLQGLARTPAEASLFDFTDPYLTVQGRIVVRRESSNIVDVEDLKSRRVAVEKDSAAHEALSRYNAIELVLLNSQVEAVEALLSGEVDAAVAYDVAARYVAEKWRKADEIKITGEPVFDLPYCIALVKGNSHLVDSLNRGLRSLKRKGIYDRIYEKWFGRPVDVSGYWSRRYLYPAVYALGALALVALGSLSWNYVLNREVRNRTLKLKEINTQLEEQRKAVAESDAFKEQILNSVGSGIVTLDRAGRIVAMNEAAACYLFPLNGGKAPDGVPGSRYDETPLATFVERASIDDCMNISRAISGVDREITLPDGRRLFFSINAYPLVNVDGEADGAIVVFTDDTERRRLQEQVHRQNKLQALGQMLAGAAHEIKNPLSCIKNFTDLLPRKFDVPSFRDEFLHHVPAEVARLDRIVCDLLDFARPRAPAPEIFRVRSLVESVLASCRKALERRDARVDVTVGEETVFADLDQMKQVMINVLLNSAEWIRERGRVVITSWVEDDVTVIKVTDDGRGIPEEALRDVFNPFFTLRQGGTGLGLTLSHQYVSDNGGSIDIESIRGSGTSVVLRLPSTPGPQGGSTA
ncbi:MAG: transporter substrate-binding domain-containing protein [Firmicutes bacterium]|nr:transporter substrate-binding domain-containing protein [Bacillota bacterium]